ncbi:MAG: hypothetical protein D6767_00435, partial [Candidatus Hydrogenedentota bacterium]
MMLPIALQAQNYAEKYFQQGKAYERVGNIESAHYYYMLAYRKNPNRMDILEAYARTLALTGKLYEAAARFRDLLQKKPN